MDKIAPPWPSQFKGRRVDFVVAFTFWAMLLLGFFIFIGIRARSLMVALDDIDDIKEAPADHAGNFSVPMLIICELSNRNPLLDVLSVEVTSRYRDPTINTKTKQTAIIEGKTLQPEKGSVNQSVPGSREPGFSCYRFNPSLNIPDDAEQVDGYYTVRAAKVGQGENRKALKDRERMKIAASMPSRLYQGRQQLRMISGFFFRLSIAENMSHPIGFEQEMMRHVGIPLESGVRIVDVLARPFSFIWKDTMGGRQGAKHSDTKLLDVSQFTRFEPIPDAEDPRVVLKFVLATSTVEIVEHVNNVFMNYLTFFKDCAAITIIFTAMAVVFQPVRKEIVQKRFFYNICGLGSPEPEEEERSPLLEGAPKGGGEPAAPPKPAEEPRPFAKPGSAAAAEPGPTAESAQHGESDDARAERPESDDDRSEQGPPPFRP